MEESDLLKERLQAITEKHRIQEDIRQKKRELDQEKLKLQHLKKKALREQWLLQDSTSHNATDTPKQQRLLCEQQQTRALQRNIHRIELEVESLEREESVISTNESFILNRLKAVEKSPEDIIKEAQSSFVLEHLQVTTAVPNVPESFSPPAAKHSEPSTPRKTLFAMEINVTKNLLTGESTVLSTAAVPPDDVNQHAALKVYDDGRKCVYALNSHEGSHDRSCVSELSANEVEQLLKNATLHRQVNRQNYHRSQSRKDEHCFYNHQHERNQGGHHGNRLLGNNATERDFREQRQRRPGMEDRYGYQGSHYRRQEERNNQSNTREGHLLGNHKGLGYHHGNQKDHHHSSQQARNCRDEDRPFSRRPNGVVTSNRRVNEGRANGGPPPRSHAQEVASARQPQLCYTPANHIPLCDYISVDEEELYCPASHHSHNGNPPAVSSTPADRAPSPLYQDDAAYTILNAMDTTEPITAIFMGFQTAQDDSGQGQEFEGSLKAELVIIEDHEDKKSHSGPGGDGRPTGSSANARVGPGIRKIPKKHKACCAVC